MITEDITNKIRNFMYDIESEVNRIIDEKFKDKELKKEPDIFDLNLVSSEEHNELKEKFNNLQQKYDDLEEKYIFLETAIERECNSNLEETKNDGRVKHYHMHYSRSLQYIYDTVDREIAYSDKIEELIQTNWDLCVELNTVQTALKTIYNKLKP